MKVTRLGWAAALVFLVFFAHPRHLWLNNLGLLAVLAGLALRVWAAGNLPGKGPFAVFPRALELGAVLVASGFALMCTSLRHWLLTLLLWAAFAELLRRLLPGGVRRPASLDAAWGSSDFSWDRAVRLGEKKTLILVLLAAFYLRFKMVYTW